MLDLWTTLPVGEPVVWSESGAFPGNVLVPVLRDQSKASLVSCVQPQRSNSKVQYPKREKGLPMYEL